MWSSVFRMAANSCLRRSGNLERGVARLPGYGCLTMADLVDAGGDGLIDDPDDSDDEGVYMDFDFEPLRGVRAITVNSIREGRRLHRTR